MSYDVHLEADLGGPEPFDLGLDFNHTINTSSMWRAAGINLAAMDGWVAGTCELSIRTAADLIESDTPRFRALETGWGTVETTVKFLRDIADACRQAPMARLRVKY